MVIPMSIIQSVIRRVFGVALLLAVSLFSSLSMASIDTWTFESPEMQSRYTTLTHELRCPKCDGQSIGGSNAPIANDLREVVFNKIQAGESDEQIVDFMVDRYGEFVLYKPRVEGKTLLLWYLPVGFAGVGFIIFLFVVLRSRRTRNEPETAELDAEERERVEKLLSGKGDSQ